MSFPLLFLGSENVIKAFRYYRPSFTVPYLSDDMWWCAVVVQWWFQLHTFRTKSKA